MYGMPPMNGTYPGQSVNMYQQQAYMPAVYAYPQQQYPRYYQPQQPFRVPQSPTSRVIRGAASQIEDVARPKTVVIPNGSDGQHRYAPAPQRRAVSEEAENEQEYDRELSEHMKNRWKAATQIFPRLSPAEDHVSARMAESVFKPEPDVKVFTPKKRERVQQEQPEQLSPYERLKTPLKEYKTRAEREREETRAKEEAPLPPVRTEGTEQKHSPSAGAISAYSRSMNPSASQDDEPGRSDFSSILDNIRRDDGFEKDEGLVDSDGLPISHKTKHVMNALFGSAKASPFVNVNRREDNS